MSKFPTREWMTAFQEKVNRDEELALIGRWFTLNILLGAGEDEFVLCLKEGQLVEVIHGPRFDTPWSFAMRAPREHWENFIKPMPPPLFNEIWAMVMRVPEFKLEGNTLAAAQNIRALQRFMSLMRTVDEKPVDG